MAPPLLTGKRVLVVDDDMALRVLLSAVRKRLGATVRTAGGDEEALRALADEYDLIILDLFMPRVSGSDVLESLRTHHPHVLARVLINTAYSGELGHLLGNLPVLRKPFDLEELLLAITAQPLAPDLPPLDGMARATQNGAEASNEPHRVRRTAGKDRRSNRAQGRTRCPRARRRAILKREARIAGRKSGEATSRDRAHMTRIGAKGGARSLTSNRAPTPEMVIVSNISTPEVPVKRNSSRT
jgi:CheY-like chemotaxis protein/general stress protein YciG